MFFATLSYYFVSKYRKFSIMRFLILPLFLFIVFSGWSQTTDLGHQTPYLLENKGQLSNSDGTPAGQVLYYMNTPKLDFFVTNNGITYVFKNGRTSADPDAITPDLRLPDPITEIDWHRVDVTPQNGKISSQQVKAVYSKADGGVSIYNQNVSNGINLQPIESITISNVYPGIDWQFIVSDDNLKYNFIVHNGADISEIKLLFEGQDKISLEQNKLIVSTSLGSLTENEIESFTSKGKSIDVRPVLENNLLTYTVDQMPELGADETLIIDPPLVWATYYGGSADDRALVMERNANGFMYVLARVASSIFPLLDQGGTSYYQGSFGGVVDIAILKFTEDGVLSWATYYGGSGDDSPSNLFYNGAILMVVGTTASADFPTLNPGLGAYFDGTLNGTRDGFIIAFSLGDTRIWSTYFGGSAVDDVTDCTFKNMRLIITGQTTSADFPMLANGTAYYDNTINNMDVYVSEFNNIFNLTWSTLYGGSDVDLYSYCDIDSIGRLLITYQTASTDIPLNNTLAGSYSSGFVGTYDQGITMFNSSRELIWHTYVGGLAIDYANDVICDYKNQWIFTGVSSSTDFPVINSIGAGFYQATKSGAAGTYDATLMKFDSTGSMLYCSYYGGTAHDYGFGLTLDSTNNLYLVGSSQSLGLFTYNPNDGSYFDNSQNGGYDGFLVELDSSFNTKWATYIGGSSDDPILDVRVSPSNHVFAVGYTGSNNHPTFDLNPGVSYFDNSFNGGTRDAMIMKFIPCPDNFNTISGLDSACFGSIDTLVSTGSFSYLWGDGSVSDSLMPTIISDTLFSITATHLWGCIEHDTFTVAVKPLPVIGITGDSIVCFSDTVHLFASGGIDYQWGNGLLGDTVTYVPLVSDTLTLSVTNSYNCSATDSVAIKVHPLPVPSITGDTTVCMNDTLILEANGGIGFLWSNTTTDSTIEISQSTSGFFNYYVVVTDTNSCIDTAFQTIEVFSLPVFDLGNDTTLCQGNSLLLTVSFTNATYSWSTSAASANISVNTPGDYSLLVTDSNNCRYTDTINVAVIPYANATIDSIPYVCENNPTFDFTAAETGGTWSGTGITVPSTGTFDPAVAGVGFFSVYYTIGGFCGDTDSTIIEIAEVPSFTFVSTNETCAGANDGTLIVSASGGAAPYTFILDTVLIGDTTTNLTPRGYNLFVLDTRGCVETDSVFILAEDFPCGEVNFYIPNIFSPNGDGFNDVLYVRSNFIENIKFLIYDRFGEKVFESNNIDNGWDGKYNGQPVASGVYHYFINVDLIDGTHVDHKGNITVVR